ncbi:hypothetical protein SAMN04244574_04019 [Azotobacter beijerinckii]|uniref:Uncharacterized protein n=1 Tax=Azotobacter beijerinckii TaxID=170623 RepID=A0A1I4GXG5_9GAMM|nr:hypothetical protein SAMN04244571_04539 [Azotobacter beijerinckii]SFL34230.1 hypothetical protein SAMN04244574_04019 [Azotobacter beijerinckii]
MFTLQQLLCAHTKMSKGRFKGLLVSRMVKSKCFLYPQNIEGWALENYC